MKKIQIKGKDYVEVHERVKEFHNQYPNGSISTEIIEMTDRFITKTTVIPDIGVPERCFTGVAYEKEDDSFINKTSALENCETSSVGRALGFLNIGIDTSIASYDEVSNAINQQKSKPAPKQTMNVDSDLKVTVESVKEKFGGSEIKNLVNFGKHNGKDWSEVPEDYINWVCKNSKVDWQRDEAQKELDRRNGNVPDRPNRASGGMSEVALEEVDEFEGMPS